MSDSSNIQQGMSDKLTSVFPPIEFPCIVGGEKLLAKIVQVEDHPTSFIYHVRFNNGYKSSFYSIENELGFYEVTLGNSEYAKGIRGDLKCICGFALDRELYCLNMDESGEEKNVWIKQNFEKDNEYNVYSPGLETTYRFSIKKTDQGWFERHANPKVLLSDADNILAAKVCKFIDQH